MYDRQSATVRKQSTGVSGVKISHAMELTVQGTTVLSHADTLMKGLFWLTKLWLVWSSIPPSIRSSSVIHPNSLNHLCLNRSATSVNGQKTAHAELRHSIFASDSIDPSVNVRCGSPGLLARQAVMIFTKFWNSPYMNEYFFIRSVKPSVLRCWSLGNRKYIRHVKTSASKSLGLVINVSRWDTTSSTMWHIASACPVKMLGIMMTGDWKSRGQPANPGSPGKWLLR